MPLNPAVEGYLESVDEELDAVRRLVKPPPNRLGAYHMQQAVEKLAKAVLLWRGMPATNEHRIELLLSRLPVGDPWKARLEPFQDWTVFATAYRYPTPTGRLKNGPSEAEIHRTVDALEQLRKQLLAEASS